MSRANARVLTGLILVLTLNASVLAEDCPNVTFTLEQTLGGYPGAVENLRTVDYDHDGKLDLVGGIEQAGGFATLHSWRGVGDGTFEPAVSLGDTQVMDLQVINVNNDAYDDLVGVSYNSKIWTRLGNATGFDVAIVTSVNYTPYDLHAGNFNEGTADVDLVTSQLFNGIFVVYQGNGDGTFTETRRVTVASPSDWITNSIVADFDNDGRFDVALGRRIAEKLEVYFRNVDGTFASSVSVTTGTWPDELLAADFNEDGLPDLVSNNWDEGTIDVFENLGSRTFASRQILAGSPPGHGGGLDSLHVVDINGDANLDILAGAVNGEWVAIHLGEGDGTFRSGSWFTTGDSVFSIASGNFDGATDAYLELALGSDQFDAGVFSGKLLTADYACAPQVNLYSVAPVISSGQTAKFRAAVSGFSDSTPNPLGSVTFKEGATTLGTDDVDADGLASLDLAGMSVGDHTITAEFSGNSTIDPATSPSIVQKVRVETSATTITVGTSTHGEPFDSTVVIKSIYNATTLGYYYLTLDGVTESATRWSGAMLSLTLSAGPHSISAEFTGDSVNPPSTSPNYNFTTAKHAVTLAKSGDTTVREGTAHSIQITVSATTSPTPTGSVELFRGATSVGSGVMSGGIATINATLPRGAYEYTAVYSGDTSYLTGSTAFTLNVLANAPLAIDAHGLDSTVSVPAVVPAGTTATTMYRSVSGANSWSAVSNWTLISPVDDGTGMTRGVLYDYRLDAIVSGNLQQSNIDSALLYTDNTLVSGGTAIKLGHFSEVRSSVNALRTMAGLPPFVFDGTFGAGMNVLASHVTALRTAVSEARTAMGMVPATFTDGSVSGLNIKTVHVTDLRDAAR